MADLPDRTARAPSAGNADESSPMASAVPAWLAARRARAPLPEPAADDDDIEFASIPETDSSPEVVVDETSKPAGLTQPSVTPPALIPSAGPVFGSETAARAPHYLGSPRPIAESRGTTSRPPPLPARGLNRPGPILPALSEQNLDEDEEHKSFKQKVLCWIRSTATAGILVSFLLHSVLLTILGLLVLGGTSIQQGLEIFGVVGDAEVMPDIDLDSTMPIDDPGKDAAALEFPDFSQVTGDEKPDFDPASTIRGALDGIGEKSGEGGQGEGFAVPALNVPKYAITKGSYSVWTVPKDPAPGVAYQIVIQFRLPGNVKTYRGSDLSGMVTGTDGYKQAIRFSRTETFPVEKGIVQLRIRVPGADRLVRDIIRIESKLLREKQVVEIEF
jgi:hypothetical protein